MVLTDLVVLRDKCRRIEISFVVALLRHAYFKLKGKKILASGGVRIRGLENIETPDLLQIGMAYVGFMNNKDATYLNVNGKLKFNGRFSIGKGCRFDIGNNAVVEFGNGYVNPNCIFVIHAGLKVGDGCAISWGCQFLDEDFHEINYLGKKEKPHQIELGEHVWIGSNVTILKGAVIPDGCVVASGSVVTSKFETKNALLAGNPAKIIKEGISWS